MDFFKKLKKKKRYIKSCSYENSVNIDLLIVVKGGFLIRRVL